MNIENIDGREYLKTVEKNSVDLILTDPPYIISRETGMNTHFNKIEEGTSGKTEEQWEDYKQKNNITTDEKKKLYLEYGSIYGKKYSVKTDYGDWDKDFTLEVLEEFVEGYYKVLKKGGTCIIFFDIWKMSELKKIMEKHKFKQIRFIEWIKTNPQPLNSRVNYLTNCREIALLGVKGGKPTFNSSYDNGIYHHPIQGGKIRCHPTQKSQPLFEELIKKHSNIDDLVMDTFLGSGTTSRAAQATGRKFTGCELDIDYFNKCIIQVKSESQTL